MIIIMMTLSVTFVFIVLDYNMDTSNNDEDYCFDITYLYDNLLYS